MKNTETDGPAARARSQSTLSLLVLIHKLQVQVLTFMEEIATSGHSVLAAMPLLKKSTTERSAIMIVLKHHVICQMQGLQPVLVYLCAWPGLAGDNWRSHTLNDNIHYLPSQKSDLTS